MPVDPNANPWTLMLPGAAAAAAAAAVSGLLFFSYRELFCKATVLCQLHDIYLFDMYRYYHFSSFSQPPYSRFIMLLSPGVGIAMPGVFVAPANSNAAYQCPNGIMLN